MMPLVGYYIILSNISTVLEVVHVTTNSVVLHFLANDYVNTTFRMEVDGQYWAHTVKSLYTVSGLASDRDYTIAVDVIRNGGRVRTLWKTARTRQLSECYFSHSHTHQAICIH